MLRCEAIRDKGHRMTSRLFLCVALFTLLPGLAHAQPGAVAAIDEVVTRFADSPQASQAFHDMLRGAVDTNPRLGQAVAQQLEAKQAKREAKAALYPTLGVNVTSDRSLSREFRDRTGNLIESSRPRARTDATVSGQQLLYDFGATANRIEGAKYRIDGAEAGAKQVATEVAVDAARAYFDVLRARAQVEMGRDFIARHEQILADVKLRQQQGYGPAGDVARVEGYLASAEGQIAGFDRQRAQAEARFLEVFGFAAPPDLTRPVAATGASRSRDEAVDTATKNNAALSRIDALTKSAASDYRVTRSQRWPSIAFAVDASAFGITESGTDYDVRGRVVARYSVFEGGAATARAAQAFQRLRQAEANESQAQKEVERQASIAWEDMSVLERQAETLRRSYEANKRTRDLFVEQFRVARGSLIDVLQSEQDYFEAAVRYLDGLTELDVARYTLLGATGELLDVIGVTLSFSSAKEVLGRE